MVDGSDNLATRYLPSAPASGQRGPLVAGSSARSTGRSRRRGHTKRARNGWPNPTYRCLFPDPPEPGTIPTCAEAGVLGALDGPARLDDGARGDPRDRRRLRRGDEGLLGRLLLVDARAMRLETLRYGWDENNPAERFEGRAGGCRVRRGVTAQSRGPLAPPHVVRARFTAMTRRRSRRRRQVTSRSKPRNVLGRRSSRPDAGDRIARFRAAVVRLVVVALVDPSHFVGSPPSPAPPNPSPPIPLFSPNKPPPWPSPRYRRGYRRAQRRPRCRPRSSGVPQQVAASRPPRSADGPGSARVSLWRLAEDSLAAGGGA